MYLDVIWWPAMMPTFIKCIQTQNMRGDWSGHVSFRLVEREYVRWFTHETIIARKKRSLVIHVKNTPWIGEYKHRFQWTRKKKNERISTKLYHRDDKVAVQKWTTVSYIVNVYNPYQRSNVKSNLTKLDSATQLWCCGNSTNTWKCIHSQMNADDSVNRETRPNEFT